MSSTSFYVLFESASGFGLFSVLENEEIGTFLNEVQSSIKEFSKFQRVVKLVAFQPFDSAENALHNINSITEHEITDDLRVSLQIYITTIQLTSCSFIYVKRITVSYIYTYKLWSTYT